MKKFSEINESINTGDEIPSAVEFLQSFTTNPDDDTIYKAMIEFAKLHVEAALKAAHSNMQLPEEDLEFTLDSYPVDKIK